MSDELATAASAGDPRRGRVACRRRCPRGFAACRAAWTSSRPSTSSSTWARSTRPRTACCTSCWSSTARRSRPPRRPWATCTAASRSSPSRASTTRSARCWTARDYIVRACTPRRRSRSPSSASPRSRCPRRRHWIRSLAMELNRIASHAIWIGTFGMDAGAMAPFLYMMRDREALLDILEAISGGRMMFNYVRPGGVFADLPAGHRRRRSGRGSRHVRHVPGRVGRAAGRQRDLPDPRARTSACSSRETALAFGLTGACLRGSGVDFDVRKAMPYCAYPRAGLRGPARARRATAGTATRSASGRCARPRG